MTGKSQERLSRNELLLHTSIAQLIPRMAIPTIIAQLITTIYNLSDTYFVSTLGTYATAAVGVNGSLERSIALIGSLIGSGACSYIARLLGAKQKEEADTVLSTSFFTGLMLGIGFTVVGIVFMEQLVYLLGATEDCAIYARQYARYVLLAAPFMTTSIILNMCLRNEGNAARAMVGIGAGGILNVILDPIFIFGFRMGVAGASLATAISKLVSFGILVYPYLRRKTAVHLHPARFRYRSRDVKEVFGIGSTAFFRTGCMVFSGIVLNRMAGQFSTSVLAAVSVSNRVMEFPFSIILGFGQGFQPVVGYNWGARAYGRVRESLRFGSVTAVVSAVVMGGVLFALAANIIQLFNSETDAQVLRLGVWCVRLQSAALPLQAWGMIINMFFAGTGIAGFALLMSTARQGYCLIPLLFLVPPLYGAGGLIACQALADCLAMLVAVPLALAALRMIQEQEKTINQ